MNDLKIEIAKSRTWAEIDLNNLAENFKILRAKVNPAVKFLAVCKADAYGHGAVECAKKFESLGADYLAVASAVEGVQLRNNGIKIPVLCLSCPDPSLAELLLENKITVSLGDFESGKKISDLIKSKNSKLKIHVKIDTGMSRTGFYWPSDENEKLKCANEIKNLCELPGFEAEGIFTHFAAADDDENFTALQLEKFLDAKKILAGLGIKFKISHAAASSGLLNFPSSLLDMIRAGLALYGYADTEKGNENSSLNLKPVMKVKSKIIAVRSMPAHSTISYGRTFELKRDSKIAVLPVGYADGFNRLLSNNFSVKIHGSLCPILGRICMDMCMADVTDLKDVRAGDIATILDGDLIPAAAKNSNTIIHEILCGVSSRVPRVFL